MTRVLILVVVFASCDKSSSPPAPKPVGGSAALAAGDAAEVDAMVADMWAYTEQLSRIALAWDGDCTAHAKRIMVLEPIAQKIRAGGAWLEADPAKAAAFQAAMADKKPAVMAALDKELAAAGMTKQDLDRREAEMDKKCATDPAYTEAVDRVSLRKKP